MILIVSNLGEKSLKNRISAVQCHKMPDESVIILKVMCCPSQLLYQYSMQPNIGAAASHWSHGVLRLSFLLSLGALRVIEGHLGSLCRRVRR